MDVFDCFDAAGFGARGEIDVCGGVLGKLEDRLLAESDVAWDEDVSNGFIRKREKIVPPVIKITFPSREGMSVEGLKEMLLPKRGYPNGILFFGG